MSNRSMLTGEQLMKLLQERAPSEGKPEYEGGGPSERAALIPHVYDFADEGECILCGYRLRFVEFIYQEKGLCFFCADTITNLFSYCHSGEYTTPSWDHFKQPRTKPKKKTIGHGLRKKVFERDKYRCVHCDTHKDLSVDHIYPESKGGTLDLQNLQTLCKSCNSKKGVKV